MLFYDSVSDGQPESVAGFLGSIKRIENSDQVFFADAFSRDASVPANEKRIETEKMIRVTNGNFFIMPPFLIAFLMNIIERFHPESLRSSP